MLRDCAHLPLGRRNHTTRPWLLNRQRPRALERPITSWLVSAPYTVRRPPRPALGRIAGRAFSYNEAVGRWERSTSSKGGCIWTWKPHHSRAGLGSSESRRSVAAGGGGSRTLEVGAGTYLS